MTIAASSPITMPVFGSPSAVYAYAWSDSLSNEIFFSSTSACDAKALLIEGSPESSRCADADAGGRGDQLLVRARRQRNAVAAALRRDAALGLARQRDRLGGAFGGGRRAHPSRQRGDLARERIGGADLRGVGDERRHVVEHRMRGAAVLHTAARQRAADDLAHHRQRPAFVLAERQDRAIRLVPQHTRVRRRPARVVDQQALVHRAAFVDRDARLAERDRRGGVVEHDRVRRVRYREAERVGGYARIGAYPW